MNRRLKAMGWILGVVMLVVTIMPVFGFAHVDGDVPASVIAGDFTSPDAHHDAHHGVCAAICVVPLVADTTFVSGYQFRQKLRFRYADLDSDSHVGEGPRKPPRV